MNILIGSCGGLSGIYFSKVLRKNHKIIGIDANDNAMHFFVHKFVKVPKSGDVSYINILKEIIVSHKIDIYIPTHSKEISLVSGYVDELEELLGTKIVISPEKSITYFTDKYASYKGLADLGINVPKIIDSPGDITSFPIIMKPRTGSGGNGIFIVEAQEEYEALKKRKNYFFTEYIKAPEYTIDCFFSGTSNLLGYNVRKRVKNIGGAVSITETAHDIVVKDTLDILRQNFSFVGAVNFQFFRKNEQNIFFDFNIRPASGGMPLTVQLGLNIPELLIKEALRQPVPETICMSNKHMTMYRYFKETYE